MKYAQLYGFNHKRTQSQFEATWKELRDAVPKRKGGVVLGVANDRLLLDGVAIESGHSERGFAQLLTASGLGSIQFLSEVTAEEFEKLVRAFAAANGLRTQELTAEIRSAFPDNKGRETLRSRHVQ